MKIETKFDIGQDVFYIFGTGLSVGCVNGFEYSRYGIFYFLNGNTKRFTENELFATRNEALQKLKELEVRDDRKE